MRTVLERVSHPSQSFRFLRYEVEAFRSPLHRHPQLELTWIEQGVGLRLLGDSALPYEAGDLIMVGSGVPHAWMTSSQGGPLQSVATVVQFPGDLFAQAAIPELAQVAPVMQRADRGLEIHGDCHRRITERLREMREATSIGRLAGLVDILGLLVEYRETLSPIARNGMSSAGDPSGRMVTRRIDRVIDWIHDRFAEELRIGDAARLVNISQSAFSRFFCNEVGKPFTQYINDVRCSAACVMLRQSGKAISIIAEECGFPTMSHFNRQFRLRMGLTPRAFREPAGHTQR
ncbi:MAG: AraC family transcriptional regulator [Propionivibrio sp.]